MPTPLPLQADAHAYPVVHLFPLGVPDPTCTPAAPCAECRAWAAETCVDGCGAKRADGCRDDCAGEAT